MRCGFRKGTVLLSAAVWAAFVCLCALLAVPAFASSPVSLPLTQWVQDGNHFENSSYEINNGVIVVHNFGGNVFSLWQKVSVKPNTQYRISAQVRMEGYNPTENGDSGATVLFGRIGDDTCWNNSFVTSSEWSTSSVVFNSGNASVVGVSLAVGMWASACEGTAYFKDVTLEEISTDVRDNHWNILALIYRNVDAPGFKKSFSDDDVKELKRTLENYPDAVKNLSDSRMLIDRVDTYVIDTPVRSVSGSNGDFTTGKGNDIDFDSYLKDRDYQLIVVYAPLTDSPGYTGWGGLGGTWYEYDGQIIYYLTICLIWDRNGDPFSVQGGHYDTDTAALLHEHLHCVETNSSYFIGWDGYTRVHNNAEQGFLTTDNEWLDWYVALMRDEGLDGKGFKPRSFYVLHSGKPDAGSETGDVDDNGRVDAKDRMLLARFLSGQEGSSDRILSRSAADIDRNGYLEKADLTILARTLAGWKEYTSFLAVQ